MTAPRIACLWVPDLPLVAALRAEPALASAPLAVVQPAPSDNPETRGGSGAGLRSAAAERAQRAELRHEGGPRVAEGESGELRWTSRARVLGATAAAEGVHAGQTLAEAQARCPDLRVRAVSPERVRAAALAAQDAASSLTPRLEQAEPGLIYLDVAGLESLIGDEREVARALLCAAEAVGLCAAIGLAGGKRAALLAARAAAQEICPRATRAGVGGGAFRVVPREEQAAFLDALPLSELSPSDELLRAARRLGIFTLGELGRISAGPLSARLGPEGAALHRAARGEDRSTLVARPLPERFEEGEELDWEVSSLEPLLFVWKSLLDRLSARLSARGLAAVELHLLLRLGDGAWDQRAIDLAAPTREVAPLLALLKLEVEARPPPSGVCAVRLSALPGRERREQLPLFGPRGQSPTQLAAAVARLSALVGPDRVGQPVAPDTHRPFAAALSRFSPPPPSLFPTTPLLPPLALEAIAAVNLEYRPPAPSLQPPAQPSTNQVPLASRALRPPRTAEVRCDDQGNPRLVIGEGALGGRVVASAGPWRTLAEWWTESPLALDSYDLEIAGGLLLRASRELHSGSWWIEAVYD